MNNYFWTLLVLGLLNVEAAKVVYLTRQQAACQFGHDFIRGNHDVEPVQWDEDIAYGAEDWAIRLALSQKMEHSTTMHGENLYTNTLNSVHCANPLANWYSGIKHFNYDEPKWTSQDGSFIQEVYNTMSRFGVGTAAFEHNVYVVGRYDKAISSAGPFNNKYIPKPKKSSISIDDLTDSSLPQPTHIEIKCPEVDGWTDWIQTSACSAECGVGNAVEERWCVRLHDEKGCEGERKRTVSCKKTNCGSCQDLHMKCKNYVEKNFCNHSVYSLWMKQNCPNSCKFCNDDAKESVVYDEEAVSNVKVLQNKAKVILL